MTQTRPATGRWLWALLIALPLAVVAVVAGVYLKSPDQAPAPFLAGPKSHAVAETLLVLDDEPSSPAPEPSPQRGGKGSAAGDGLRLCCDALQQNSHNVTEPSASSHRQAAGLCYAAVSSGQSKSSVVGQLKTLLAQNDLPSSCR